MIAATDKLEIAIN